MQFHDCEVYKEVPLRVAELIGPDGNVDIYPEVARQNFLTVKLRKGTLALDAAGCVGHIPLNDRHTVRVSSRVPIGGNLRALLAIAGMTGTPTGVYRETTADWDWHDSLYDVYSDALLDQFDIIRNRGFLREYDVRAATTSFPKGRIMFGATVRRHHTRGQPQRAEVTWFERMVDVPANRCIKYAIWAAGQHYMHAEPPEGRNDARRFTARRNRLNAAFAAFDGVSLDRRRAFLSDPLVRGSAPLPALRAYYELGLNVACSLASRSAISIDGTAGRRLPAMVVDLEAVFERYLLRALQLHAERSGWTELVLNGNEEPASRPLFSRPERDNLAKPDIVIVDRASTPKLVLDVKCVPRPEGVSQRDAINQVVTYAECYGVRNVVVVHPRSRLGPRGIVYQGRIGEVDLHMYRFDLSSPDLLNEDAQFGDALRALM